MALQMEVLAPQTAMPPVQWNFEELKKEIAAVAAEYNGVIDTSDDWEKKLKADRAKLNKLKKAVDDERKRVKKEYEAPVKAFEAQVKEVLKPLDYAIVGMDKQLEAAKTAWQDERRADIEKIFSEVGFQEFVTLGNLFDSSWFNKTTTLGKIRDEMEKALYRIGNEVFTINQLQSHSFEAMEEYKRTLDLTAAVAKANELTEYDRKRAEAEEKARRLREEQERVKAETEAALAAKAEEKVEVDPSFSMNPPITEPEPESDQRTVEQRYQLDFRVWVTKGQLNALKAFLTENKIEYGKVE